MFVIRKDFNIFSEYSKISYLRNANNKKMIIIVVEYYFSKILKIF